MVRKMLIGALCVVALAASPASAQYNELIVTPKVVQVGSTVSVSGRGYAGNEEVTLSLVAGDQTAGNNQYRAVPVPPGGTGVGIVVTDAGGNFTTTFVVPAGTALGLQTVFAESETLVQSDTITVIDDGAVIDDDDGQGFGDGDGNGGNGNGGTGNGNLARTGSNLNGLGLLGAGLLAVGGLVLVATRRRHGNGPARTATVA